MPIAFVEGDIFKTSAQTILWGRSVFGGFDADRINSALREHFPDYYEERENSRRLMRGGSVEYFRESQPWIVELFIRKFVEDGILFEYFDRALFTLQDTWQRENLQSLAIPALGNKQEWLVLRQMLVATLKYLPIPILVYDTYIPNLICYEPFLKSKS